MPILRLRTTTATLASAILLLGPLAAGAQVPVRPSLNRPEAAEKGVAAKALEEKKLELEKGKELGPGLKPPKLPEGLQTQAPRLPNRTLPQPNQARPNQPRQPADPPAAPQPTTPRPSAPAQAPAQQQQGLQQQPGARTPEQQAATREEARRRGRFQLDFDKADIADVVQTISDFTGKLFIVPENIRGKITIIGPEDGSGLVTADEAYAAFLSALEANNWTVYPVGQYLKLVEKRAAANTNVWTYTDPDARVPDDERIVTKVIKLRYADTDALVNPLKQLASKDASIIPMPPDTLIVTEVALNLRRLERIIEALDKPGGGDELRIIQVEYAAAAELADKLLQIFEAQSGGAGGAAAAAARRRPRAQGGQAEEQGGEPLSVTRVIADERTNKLIVIASSRAFEQIEELVRQLDVPTGDTGRINVYYLENADAEELANTLQNLVSGITGTSATAGQQQRGARRTPQPGAVGQGVGSLTGEVKIAADKATNSLVIVASAQDYKNLVRVIEKLDIRRRQVFVEAVIMEVNLNNTDEFGISLHGGATIETDDGIAPIIAGSQVGQASSLNLSSLLSMGGFLAGMQGPNVPAAAELGVALPSFGVVMHAMTRNSDVNVLSTPHILTSDNEEAEITVGQNVPFQAGYAPSGISSLLSNATASSTAASSLLSTAALTGLGSFYAPIQRQNVELKLKIKPQINESDYVRMEVEEQTEEIAQQDPQLGPTTAKRTAKTVVVAKDQTTVVIGGLIQERTINSVQKTPILGDIPVVGRLFRDTSVQRIKTNLLLFLTPYIIRDQHDFRRIFERKMRERDEFVAAFYGTAAEYEVPVDYARKAGPVALLVRDVRTEMMRLENGGPGLPGETAIRPRTFQFVPRGSVPEGEEPAEGAAPEQLPAEAPDVERPAGEAPAPAEAGDEDAGETAGGSPIEGPTDAGAATPEPAEE